MAKRFDQTYLYSVYPTYERQLFEMVMKAERVDTTAEDFSDIVYDVKHRQVMPNMIKALQSSRIVLLHGDNPLGKAAKVFTMKDVKTDNTRKTFIDCSTILEKSSSGAWKAETDRLISYLLSAMTQRIYYDEALETKLTKNVALTKFGASAYAKLMFNIIDYIAKISSIMDAKEKCKALSVMFYQVSLLGQDYNSEGVRTIAKTVSGISDRMLTTILLDYDAGAFVNLKTFCDTIAKELKISKLNVEGIVSKWMYVYDPSTTFGMELFPQFSSIITDAYIGAYLNNQKTIQKVLDTDMVQYTKTLLQIEGGM